MWNKRNKFWYVMYSIFAKNLPYSRRGKFFKWIRVFFAKKIIKKIGKNVNIETGAIFTPNVEIGDNSSIGVKAEIVSSVKIGNNVMMGPEVVIYSLNHKFQDRDKTIIEQGYSEDEIVTIEDDVWIGRRAIILPGVTVKKGTVIGAGAIVTKSFPEYSVIAGNPAKVIKTRGE